jgi:hypothetical protein
MKAFGNEVLMKIFGPTEKGSTRVSQKVKELFKKSLYFLTYPRMYQGDGDNYIMRNLVISNLPLIFLGPLSQGA